jgi:hypothetical protein
MTDLMKEGDGRKDGTDTCLMKFLLQWKCHLKVRMSKIKLILLAIAAPLPDFPLPVSAIVALSLPVFQS